MEKIDPTAGEWLFDSRSECVVVQRGSNRTDIAAMVKCWGGGISVDEEEARANGRLMAASKDLLDACLAARLDIVNSGHPDEMRDTLLQLDRAIAKARGNAS